MPKGHVKHKQSLICGLCKTTFLQVTRRHKYCSKKCAEKAKYIVGTRYSLSNRNGLLVAKYGISLDDYNELEKKQNYVCAICGNPETSVHSKTGKLWSLSVDHDHITGKVRGLLCVHCNHLLGAAKDNIDVLQRAVNYLKGVIENG